MSDEKPADADYLTRRGWTSDDERDDPRAPWWRDPLVERTQTCRGTETFDDSFTVSTVDALTIQSARDAQEERAAWVQFAAHPTMEWLIHQGRPAEHYGDYMLDEYRRRFARKGPVIAARIEGSPVIGDFTVGDYLRDKRTGEIAIVTEKNSDSIVTRWNSGGFATYFASRPMGTDIEGPFAAAINVECVGGVAPTVQFSEIGDGENGDFDLDADTFPSLKSAKQGDRFVLLICKVTP